MYLEAFVEMAQSKSSKLEMMDSFGKSSFNIILSQNDMVQLLLLSMIQPLPFSEATILTLQIQFAMATCSTH